MKAIMHSAAESSSLVQVQTTSDSLPLKYEDFGDVFETKNVDSLPEHRPYDCPIDMQEGVNPPFDPIYGLSEPELQALRTYLDENLAKGSPIGAPRLFVKKIDSSLCLCVNYPLNDILVFSSNIKEHTHHVKLVLAKLREHGLYAKSEKCEFDRTSVEFLGYVISRQAITMDSRKVKTIQEWVVLTRVRDLQSFLGFANFYRRFIKGFSMIAEPLIALPHKDITFEWTTTAQTTLDLLKQTFTTTPLLFHPN
jgi:hypothetical protein